MENLGMTGLFGGTYREKRVFLTGHTGFKGSWLAFWLHRMKADVTGYALAPETVPNHFSLVSPSMNSVLGDIRDRTALEKTLFEASPEIVFHLAAQPLVRRSYREPVETFETNVMGTANLLEACRKTPSVRAIVVVTSDKCYENREWLWGYRENDPMGGYDPYSASKGCTELLASSWRNSFFHSDAYGSGHHVLLATARAGNVVGGGDWSEDRLVSDIVRATASGEETVIRSPQAIRPWQHVLEPLGGYLLLGQKLLEKQKAFAEAWNFGPNEESSLTVEEVAETIRRLWDRFSYRIVQSQDRHEAGLLRLDCSKARMKLGWKGIWDAEMTFEKTIRWYRHYYESAEVLTQVDLSEYIRDARTLGLAWALPAEGETDDRTN